jgi:hypothetical protein
MPLVWRDKLDSAMGLFIVVPVNKLFYPFTVSSNDLNSSQGQREWYFTVLISDSEYGLSSLTLGRLREVTKPKSYILARIVKLFIGAPFPVCNIFFFAFLSLHTTL